MDHRESQQIEQNQNTTNMQQGHCLVEWAWAAKHEDTGSSPGSSHFACKKSKVRGTGDQKRHNKGVKEPSKRCFHDFDLISGSLIAVVFAPMTSFSFSANDARLTNFIDWNKKRKLEEGQLGLPLPKHKFRDRCCCSEHESPVAKHLSAEEIHYNCLQKQSKSVVDSNSVFRESDFGPSETCMDGQSSTYSGSFTIDTKKNSLHSLEISIEDATSANQETNRANSNKGLQLESGSLSSRDQQGAFVEDPNFICFEYETHGKGPCSKAEAEEMMLYSNDTTSNLYVLSSGRSVNKDAPPGGGRKPTIDQEFEQYFSMLMLNN